MPERNWQLRIEDILISIEKILNYTTGMNLEHFCLDDKTIPGQIGGRGAAHSTGADHPLPRFP